MFTLLITLVLLSSASCGKKKEYGYGYFAPDYYGHHKFRGKPTEYKAAICHLEPNPALDDTVYANGVIHLYQEKKGHKLGPLQLMIDIEDVAQTKTNLHGFHAHSVDDFSNGCDSTGGHYNPFGVDHGAPRDVTRHVGDFGNLKAHEDGEIREIIHDYRANIFGGESSIMGRPLVLHEGQDDLGRGGDDGSVASGNAGRRLACCLIVKEDPGYKYKWEYKH